MISELFLFITFVCAVAHFYGIWKRSQKLPPGPWGFPILGHLPLLGANPHTKMMEMTDRYGPVISLRFGSFPTVVLNDAKSIREAFNDPRFDGRNKVKFIVEGTQNKGIIMSEGSNNVEQRLFGLRQLHDLGLGRKIMEDKIQVEIIEFLETTFQVENAEKRTLKSEDQLFNAPIVNALWSIIMSERFEFDDPKINQLAYLLSEKINRADTVLSQLALFMPWMTNLWPNWTGYKEKLASAKEMYEYMRQRIKERKESWVKGQPRDLTDAYLDKVADTQDILSSFHEKNDFQAYFTGDLFLGAMETTTTSLEWLLYYLSKYTQVQKKIQQEIDRVVGDSRIPSLGDRTQMPWTMAVIEELLRISTVAPFGVIHRTIVDVENFQGYFIPKDTMVIGNHYGAHHLQSLWGDSDVFRPDRFLDEFGKVKRDSNQIVFSTGKRQCPGEGLARAKLFLYITSLCQRLEISMEPQEIEKVKPIFGFIIHPTPFEFQISKRQIA